MAKTINFMHSWDNRMITVRQVKDLANVLSHADDSTLIHVSIVDGQIHFTGAYDVDDSVDITNITG